MSTNIPETLSEAIKRISELESQVAQLTKVKAQLCNDDLTYPTHVDALFALTRIVPVNDAIGLHERNKQLRVADKPCEECSGFHITTLNEEKTNGE